LQRQYFRRKLCFMQEFFLPTKNFSVKKVLLDSVNCCGYNFLYRFCQIATVEEYFVIFYRLKAFARWTQQRQRLF